MSEFGEKKDVARVLEQKELKVSSLTQEVNGLRSQVRSKDRIIFGFKRELSSIVRIALPKDLEQAVKVNGYGSSGSAVKTDIPEGSHTATRHHFSANEAQLGLGMVVQVRTKCSEKLCPVRLSHSSRSPICNVAAAEAFTHAPKS